MRLGSSLKTGTPLQQFILTADFSGVAVNADTAASIEARRVSFIILCMSLKYLRIQKWRREKR
jgi:hypothetical protein